MSNERTAVMTGPPQGMGAAHQPGQDGFKSVLPEDINWKPFAALPPSGRMAVISQPTKSLASGSPWGNWSSPAVSMRWWKRLKPIFGISEVALLTIAGCCGMLRDARDAGKSVQVW
jgi:hypothetical protein